MTFGQTAIPGTFSVGLRPPGSLAAPGSISNTKSMGDEAAVRNDSANTGRRPDRSASLWNPSELGGFPSFREALRDFGQCHLLLAPGTFRCIHVGTVCVNIVSSTSLSMIAYAMAIPDFQACMLPMLRLLSDGQPRRLSEVAETLTTQFGLSEAEKSELLPSGQQTKVTNRIYWASTHLVKAALLERPSRGVLQITPAGEALLQDGPARIDMSVLERYPKYQEFRALKGTRKRANDDDEPILTATEGHAATPEDLVEQGYTQYRRALASDLLDKVKDCSPKFFERLVVELLVAMGYGGSRADAGKAVGQAGDGGIDGIIKEDKLGLDVVYIQAKRWDGPVGRPVVQGFSGSLDGHRARKGVLITTSRFTDDAIQYVDRIDKKIVLVDGEELAQLMIDHGIGVADVSTFTLRRMDADYFEE